MNLWNKHFTDDEDKPTEAAMMVRKDKADDGDLADKLSEALPHLRRHPETMMRLRTKNGDFVVAMEGDRVVLHPEDGAPKQDVRKAKGSDSADDGGAEKSGSGAGRKARGGAA